MGKLVFVFLAACIICFNATSEAEALSHHSSGHGAHVSYESHPATYTVHHEAASHDHTELFTVFAHGIFDFFAKLVRAKVEVLLWLKRAMIGLLVKGLGHVRHLFVHNGEYVNGIIHTVAELLKLLLTNRPHYAVPHVSRVISEAEHEYIPHGHY